MIRLKLHVLGSFEANLDGQPLKGFRSNKTRALLAYLATEGSLVHARETLRALLWGGYGQESARLSLRVALSNLRQILAPINAPADNAPFLTTTRQTVQVDVGSDHCWVDQTEFDALWFACEKHLHQDLASCPACVQRLAGLVELYRGDLLEGLVFPDCPEFDEWRLLRQEAYRRQALTALRILTRFYTQQEWYEQAEYYARRQIGLEPWREGTHRRLMHILAASGRRGAALAQYKTLQQILREELGSEPDEQTTDLYLKLRYGPGACEAAPQTSLPALPEPARPALTPPSPSVSWQAMAPVLLPDLPRESVDQPQATAPANVRPASAELHSMPLQLSPFFGREAELARLNDLLLDPDYRLLSLVGPGGVGKTRLALAAAEQVRHGFAEGGWFVPLAAHSPGSAGAQEGSEDPAAQDCLALAIGRALTLPFSAGSEPRAQLIEYLAQRPVLLLLDGLERPSDEFSETILQILRQAPHTTLLVTARRSLNLQAECAMRVEGLPVPDPTRPADDPESYAERTAAPSVQLFAERAARRPAGFSLSPENLTGVIRICQLVEGLPLGIELAAAQIEHATPDEIAQAINHNLDVLSTSMRDVPRRHRSLRAVFQGSWDLLDGKSRIALARASVFRDGFSQEAARKIMSDPGRHPANISPSDVAWILSELVDRQHLRQTATGRYQVPELLRRFATDKLRGPQETGADNPAEFMLDRHSTYYLAFLRQRSESLWGPNPLAACAEIQAEWENIRDAWLRAARQADTTALASSLPVLGRYLVLQGLLEQGEHLLEQASRALATAAGGEVPGLRGQLFATRARLANALDQPQRAADWAKRSLALAVTAGDPEAEGRARLHWGMALARMGKRRSARAQFEMVQACADSEIGLQAAAYIELGRLATDQGSWNQAEADLGRGLALARESKVWDSSALALLSLSDVAWQQGASEQAGRYAQESLAIYRALGDRQGILEALNNVGLAALLSGDHSRATACFTEYLACAQERGDQQTTAQALSNLGHAAYAQGDHSEAAYYFQEALRLSRIQGFRHLEASTLATLGMVYTAMGSAETAWLHLCQGLRESTAFGLVPTALNALVGVAWLQVQAGDLLPAAELLGLALNHPALEGDVRQATVEPILTELSQALPASHLDAALARGEALTLEATITRVLASHAETTI